MRHQTAPRHLRADDILYRKVNPEHWDPSTNEVDPAAFRDKYEKQSFYVKRFAHPALVLDFFARFDFARRLCKKSNPTGRDLYERNYRVAEIPVTVIFELGLEFVPDEQGFEITSKGHVNVFNAKDFAIDLAEAARILPRDELFPHHG